jgi:hypothetical protein
MKFKIIFLKNPTPESPRKYPTCDLFIHETITMNIDFLRFLPLRAIKYLLAFVQNRQLKIQFSPKGIVVANRGWEQLLICHNMMGFVTMVRNN